MRFLNFNTPNGWEDYMRDLAAALATGTVTQEEIGQTASRYDFEAVCSDSRDRLPPAGRLLTLSHDQPNTR